MITRISKSNDKFQELKQLAKANKTEDLVYVDDLSILKLVPKYNLDLQSFFFCDELTYKDETKELINILSHIANESFTLSKQTFDSLKQKENSAGLVGIIKMQNSSLDQMNDLEYLVVCDSLEIPGNIGTIYRTIDSAAVDGMILVDSVTKVNNSKLTASARGCNLIKPTASVTYKDAITWLIKNNYTIYLGEPNLGKSYREYDYSGKIAIVVGSERFGINPDWYNNKHEKVFIPMYGSNNSLNVGVAASILIYEATEKRKSK